MYYITPKNSETGKKMQALIDKAAAIRIEISDYLKAIGANPNEWIGLGNKFMTDFTAAFFDKEPNMKIWKKFNKVPGTYQPRKTNYEGKKIAAKFESIERITRYAINEIIGYDECFNTAGYDCRNSEYICFIIKQEWNHTMPADCEEITYAKYLELFNSK